MRFALLSASVMLKPINNLPAVAFPPLFHLTVWISYIRAQGFLLDGSFCPIIQPWGSPSAHSCSTATSGLKATFPQRTKFWGARRSIMFFNLSQPFTYHAHTSRTQSRGSQSSASPSPGDLLEMKILRPHFRPIELGTWGGTQQFPFNKPSMWFWYLLKFDVTITKTTPPYNPIPRIPHSDLTITIVPWL